MSVRCLRAVVALLLVAPLAVSATGCHKKKKKEREAGGGGGGGGGRRNKKSSPILVQSSGSSFKVADPQGKPLIDANMERMEGEVQSGQGLRSPIQMHGVKALLYEKGEPNMDLTAPEAVWDGEQLIATKTAHGVTRDGKTIIDGAKTIWTSGSGNLALDDAKLQGLKDGKVNFVANGPKATVVQKLVTMPEGGTGRNPDGQQMTGDHVKWHMDTAKIEADGHVVVLDTGVRVTGDHLKGDTKLSRGKISGHVRTELKSTRNLPGGKKKKGAPGKAAAARP